LCQEFQKNMPNAYWTLLAAATATPPLSPDVQVQITGTVERGAAVIEGVPADIAELPLFQHLSAVMPAADLIFGGGMLVFIVLVHAAGVRSVTTHVVRRTTTIMERPTLWKADLLMGGIVFQLLALHVLEIVFWASALVYSSLVPDWRAAGFFAGNTYTTVGYGAFVLPLGWHMLAPIIAMSGLFTFGWSGSVLVDFVRRCNTIRDAAEAARVARKSKRA
jgi:Ion channel